MDIKAAIAQLMQAKDLSGESVIEVMRAIMSGATTDARRVKVVVPMSWRRLGLPLASLPKLSLGASMR